MTELYCFQNVAGYDGLMVRLFQSVRNGMRRDMNELSIWHLQKIPGGTQSNLKKGKMKAQDSIRLRRSRLLSLEVETLKHGRSLRRNGEKKKAEK
ncbi:hypothetical protein GN244_ATG11255 [Phytophthora infestans]|uniref:Uncharacterized protein n=1 Tax=Phytophthora infestans TaxID=4787 RepID=A0A833SNV8_PHYIN|nr:hypothetical protein GN244_ATG11255 [Phytophthora infestans]